MHLVESGCLVDRQIDNFDRLGLVDRVFGLVSAGLDHRGLWENTQRLLDAVYAFANCKRPDCALSPLAPLGRQEFRSAVAGGKR